MPILPKKDASLEHPPPAISNGGMDKRSRFMLLLMSFAMAGCTPTPAPTPSPVPNPTPSIPIRPPAVSGQAMLSYLASDGLQGRGVGTAGLDSAADYVAAQFRADGLQPLPGEADYFQPFEFPTAASVDPSTTMRIGDRTLVRDLDYRPLSISGNASFDAPITFVGFGFSGPKMGYDDYADVDVKGKAVLVLRYEPRNAEGIGRFSGTKDASPNFDTFAAKAENAESHGAVAMLVVDPKIKNPLPFSVGSSDEITIPVITISPAVANDLLHQAGLGDIASLNATIDSTSKPSSVALGKVKVAGQVTLVHQIAHVKNVVAMLPSGWISDEYVVVGAHYDHLGLGKGKSPAIYHGADDNASGTTAMLEIARRMSRGTPPNRNVIFVAFTAEEEGLIGSDWFVKHPPVPLEKIVTMLNLDMVGRVRNETIYVAGGGTAGAFHDLIKQADDASPLTLKSMGEGGLGPSDHMSFALKKIPILFLFSGLHVDYHRPTDTADKINYAGIDEVTNLATDIADRLTALPRQSYVSAADASQENVSIGFDGPAGVRRVTLGVVPDYTSGDAVTGVRITDTVPDSPASKAGLQADDIIVKLGGTGIESLEGLSAALAAADAGKPTTVTVLRVGKRVELPVTLVEKESP